MTIGKPHTNPLSLKNLRLIDATESNCAIVCTIVEGDSCASELSDPETLSHAETVGLRQS